MRRIKEVASRPGARSFAGGIIFTLLVLASVQSVQAVRAHRADQAGFDIAEFLEAGESLNLHRRQAVQFALTTLIDQGSVETREGEVLSIRQSRTPVDGRYDVTVHIASSDELYYDSRVDGRADYPPMTEYEFHSKLVWRGPEGTWALTLFASQFYRLMILARWPDRSLFTR